MQMPYGKIEGNVLEISFSSADFSIASVMTAVRVHMDVLEEMGVRFLGASTDVPSGPTPVFRPAGIKVVFEYGGAGDPQELLERAYLKVWQGVLATFPSEAEWAASRRDFAAFITSQADLLRARTEASKE